MIVGVADRQLGPDAAAVLHAGGGRTDGAAVWVREAVDAGVVWLPWLRPTLFALAFLPSVGA